MMHNTQRYAQPAMRVFLLLVALLYLQPFPKAFGEEKKAGFALIRNPASPARSHFFLPGDIMRLNVWIDEDIAFSLTDVYLVLQCPDGTLRSLTAMDQPGRLVPWATAVEAGKTDALYHDGTAPDYGDGLYVWHMVLTRPGGDPRNPQAWLFHEKKEWGLGRHFGQNVGGKEWRVALNGGAENVLLAEGQSFALYANAYWNNEVFMLPPVTYRFEVTRGIDTVTFFGGSVKEVFAESDGEVTGNALQPGSATVQLTTDIGLSTQIKATVYEQPETHPIEDLGEIARPSVHAAYGSIPYSNDGHTAWRLDTLMDLTDVAAPAIWHLVALDVETRKVMNGVELEADAEEEPVLLGAPQSDRLVVANLAEDKVAVFHKDHLDNPEVLPLGWPVWDAVFSPSGDLVLLVGKENIGLLSLTEAKVLAEIELDRVMYRPSAAFSPDETLVYLGQGDGGGHKLMALRVPTLALERTYQLAGGIGISSFGISGGIRRILVHPDGKSIIAWVNGQSIMAMRGSLCLLDLETGQIKAQRLGQVGAGTIDRYPPCFAFAPDGSALYMACLETNDDSVLERIDPSTLIPRARYQIAGQVRSHTTSVPRYSRQYRLHVSQDGSQLTFPLAGGYFSVALDFSEESDWQTSVPSGRHYQTYSQASGGLYEEEGVKTLHSLFHRKWKKGWLEIGVESVNEEGISLFAETDDGEDRLSDDIGAQEGSMYIRIPVDDRVTPPLRISRSGGESPGRIDLTDAQYASAQQHDGGEWTMDVRGEPGDTNSLVSLRLRWCDMPAANYGATGKVEAVYTSTTFGNRIGLFDTFHVSVTLDTDQPVDVYVAVQPPTSSIQFVHGNGELRPEPGMLYHDWRGGSVSEMKVYENNKPYQLYRAFGSGEYTWFLLVAKAGTNPLLPDNQLFMTTDIWLWEPVFN